MNESKRLKHSKHSRRSSNNRRLSSVNALRQDTSTCYAHGISRSLVKTLQVLNVVESGFDFHFYKLFYFVITDNYGCDGESIKKVVNFLIYEYLTEQSKKDFADLFHIKDDGLSNTGIIEEDRGEYCEKIDAINSKARKPLLGPEPLPIIKIVNQKKINRLQIVEADGVQGFSDKSKAQFIDRLKKVIPYLLCIEEKYLCEYVVSESGKKETYPSLLMLDSLKKGIQPIMSIVVPANLTMEEQIEEEKKPEHERVIDYFGDGEYHKCDVDAHSVALRWWKKNSISVKNSWGTQKFNPNYDELGNIDVRDKDISTYTCYDSFYNSQINANEKILTNPIEMSHITFSPDVYSLFPFVQEKKMQIDKFSPNTDYTRNDLKKMGNHKHFFSRIVYDKDIDFLFENDLIDIRYIITNIFTYWEKNNLCTYMDCVKQYDNEPKYLEYLVVKSNINPESSNYKLFEKYVEKYKGNKERMNITDQYGNTPLHLAIKSINNEFIRYYVVKKLIDSGANIRAKNHDNLLPIDLEQQNRPVFMNDNKTAFTEMKERCMNGLLNLLQSKHSQMSIHKSSESSKRSESSKMISKSSKPSKSSKNSKRSKPKSSRVTLKRKRENLSVSSIHKK